MKGKKILSAIIAGVMALGAINLSAFAAPELSEEDITNTVIVQLSSGDESWIDSANTSWYDNSQTEFTLSTAEQLAGLASIVNNGTSFAGKTIKLGGEIDLAGKNWTPIGKSGSTFQGIFDGQGNVIKNLSIPGFGSDVGLFGFTTNGEVKNFTLENASVSGYLDVGAVAGTPYTSKYTDITVKGLIQVKGYAYVGGAFGKNGYANLTNIDVIGSEGSYVKANSYGYRTYVGGLIGFMGEGNTTISDCNVKIDVTGSTCDVGGITGNLHYGNKMINCTYEGSLKMTNAIYSENAGEIGGLAGTYLTNKDYVTSVENSSSTVTAAVVNDGTQDINVTDTITSVGTVYTEADKTNGEFSVEATVNGKTETVSNIAAKIGDNKYLSLSAAVAAAQNGDTIKVYPVEGGHDAFTVEKPITIEGVPDANGNNPVVNINETTYGGVKYNAAVTMKNLDFVVDENATGTGWCQSAVGYYYENAKDRDNSSFINCKFVNNSSLTLMGIFACYSTLTVKDCTFKNFDTGIATMLDGGTLENVAVTGNTFNAVDTLYTGYWGASNNASNIEFTGNTINSAKSDDAVPQIIIWDYSFELGHGLGVKNIEIDNTYNTPTEFVATCISNGSNITKDDITMVKSFRTADVASRAGTLAEGEVFYLNYGSATEQMLSFSSEGINLDEANIITVKLEETAEKGVYDIKLNGNGVDIYEFVGAEFTFENTSETVGGADMNYEVSGISGQTEVTKDLTIQDKYAISLSAGANRMSGSEITIGQVKFFGQGTINFSVIGGKVVTTKYNTHLEKYYSVADKNLEYGTGIIGGRVEPETRNVLVKVDYAHKLVGTHWADNQITVTLKDAFGVTSEAKDISGGEETFANVPVGRITVTLKAPGFRTYTYTTTVEEGTDPLVLSFWNDTKRDTTAQVEAGKAMTKNFVVGDIAMDYTVDKYDLAAVTSYYGTYNLTDANKIKYDLNRDGNIDITDVAYVLHNFGF